MLRSSSSRWILLTGLVLALGCQKHLKTVQIVTPDLNTIDQIREGQVLEFHLQQAGKGTFYVHFVGLSPCGADKQDIPFVNGVAQCTATKPLHDGPIMYEYYIDSNKVPEHPLGGPRTCDGCRYMSGNYGNSSGQTSANSSGQTAPNSSGQGASTSDVTRVPRLESGSSKAPASGNVFITCAGGKIDVSGPDNPVNTIWWTADGNSEGWSVVFPTAPAPSPCIEKGPFNQDNFVCTLSGTRLSQYSYSVTTRSCPAATSFTVDIPSAANSK